MNPARRLYALFGATALTLPALTATAGPVEAARTNVSRPSAPWYAGDIDCGRTR